MKFDSDKVIQYLQEKGLSVMLNFSQNSTCKNACKFLEISY